jgi:hypothetical protein
MTILLSFAKILILLKLGFCFDEKGDLATTGRSTYTGATQTLHLTVKLLVVLASTVISVSESHGIHGIFLYRML